MVQADRIRSEQVYIRIKYLVPRMNLIPPAVGLTQTVKGLHQRLPYASSIVDSGVPELYVQLL